MMNKKEMITLVSGTNRKGSNTRIFVKAMCDLMAHETKNEVKTLDLCELQGVELNNDMFTPERQNPIIRDLQNEFILPASKFVFVIPEYNGSYPGILKYFIDACSVREYDNNFLNKRAFLIGVSTGRAGNLRGLDQLTSVLNYLQTHVHPVRLPVSRVTEVFDRQGPKIVDEELLALFEKHLYPFVNQIDSAQVDQNS
ncbi:MAG: NADPH-dependent oxidoreductase [Bacteroidetes bacterium]|jgi:NAD(P)H-dependent FMN reductase|nr:NADPH-dependent oxidoreductase [Bacteroidota bacterium]